MLKNPIIRVVGLATLAIVFGCTEAPLPSTSNVDTPNPNLNAETVSKQLEADGLNLPEAAPKMTKYNELNELETHVILNKGTERPNVGKYTDTEDVGTYLCRRCNASLYTSEHKFRSDCGWPAFDDEIEGAVTRHPDADGMRVEIVCTNCDGHLGHVFQGEQLTAKNTRHCVNSVSMTFVPGGEELPAKIEKPAE